MNHCSKLLRYVYEMPNVFIRRILQAEPQKVASVVKPKTHLALGIVVDLLPHCTFAFVMTKHSSKLGHLSDP